VRILFVDDDPRVLNAIERQLRRDRERWDMVFVVGGKRGVDEIRKGGFTVVVSDFRMPEVDGVALLNEAAAVCPEMVPIMLSGDAEAEVMTRAVPALRQLIRKPCDTATLRAAIEVAVATVRCSS
jgi:DNA-binding NtrC family response regulator